MAVEKEWIEATGTVLHEMREVKHLIRQLGPEAKPIYEKFEEIEDSLVEFYHRKVEEAVRLEQEAAKYGG